MTTTAAKKKAEDQTTAAVALPADGLPSQMAYLTRALKTSTTGRVWEELADRESAGTTMRIRTAHFPAVKTLRGLQSRPSAAAAP